MGTLFSRVLLGIRSIRSCPANYRRAARGNLVARFGGDESVGPQHRLGTGNGRRRRKVSGVRATNSVPATRRRSYLADPPSTSSSWTGLFVTGIAGDVDRYLFTCTIVDMARSLKLHVVGCRGCRDNGAVASSRIRLGAKLAVRPYRSIRQAAVGRETAERPKSVLKSC